MQQGHQGRNPGSGSKDRGLSWSAVTEPAPNQCDSSHKGAALNAGPADNAGRCRRSRGQRRGSSDPSGYVMEDLLAHAVDNMRIKNVSKTQLARRAEQPKPSLLVSAYLQYM